MYCRFIDYDSHRNQKRLQGIADTLVAKIGCEPFQIKMAVVPGANDKPFSAWLIGRHEIHVNDALAEQFTDAELLWVSAHEIGHTVLKHGFEARNLAEEVWADAFAIRYADPQVAIDLFEKSIAKYGDKDGEGAQRIEALRQMQQA